MTPDRYVWQDREIRFDVQLSYVVEPNHSFLFANIVNCYRALELRPGEVLIDTLNNVEDTKGNSGEGGSLMITNLRIIWISSFDRSNLWTDCTVVNNLGLLGIRFVKMNSNRVLLNLVSTYKA